MGHALENNDGYSADAMRHVALQRPWNQPDSGNWVKTYQGPKKALSTRRQVGHYIFPVMDQSSYS
eukprot:3342954-Prorocentrum_lima.AAC.1